MTVSNLVIIKCKESGKSYKAFRLPFDLGYYKWGPDKVDRNCRVSPSFIHVTQKDYEEITNADNKV